jgi:multiple sugar transport system permease protein
LKRNWLGWFFVLPSILGVLIFEYGPVISVFFLGLTKYEITGVLKWVGLSNYQRMFTDPVFARIVFNTAYFSLAFTLLSVVISFALALLVSRGLRLESIFRTVIFIPVIVSMIAATYVWRWMYNSNFGIVNYLLSRIGIEGPMWLDDPRWSMFGIILMSLWKSVGYYMVIFIAGLKNIPPQLYEVAEIDGAGSIRKLLRITFPMISPTTFFVVVVAFINSFLNFEQTYGMTRGGPANSTLTLALEIYNRAFVFFDIGYASAVSFVFFLMILLIIIVQIRFQSRWVHYQ